MVTKRTGKTRIADVERYRIAQRFHELALAGREAFVAASQLARRHGVSTDEVFAFADEFSHEPFWRL
jgi:hypothetical protein